ncbi:hypothetical protein K437DRAFT_146658 [Tilletiaria anomala UBC 951]|uniref:Uncharacterized protein n=1 Tax=Tilletiaria anomala (strain ATCC 24038 / CBS 436.72 / UBC 951) TaxID=1037660 RepID=A0A066VZ49_TILAU|nr:uncharacterized protein K437DRAFT_146658 [Tilletiaria anomala UBC 951]KDN43795.1 hypothetical protein K437DRAFT_146658 [Tilletiaria anomala UBC 951]
MSNQSPWQSSPALRPKREDEYYQQECGASQQQHRSFGQAPSPMTPLNHGAPTASTTSLYYAHHPSSHQQQQQQQQPQPQHLQQQEQQSPHVLQPSVHAGQQQSGRQDSAYAPTHQAPFLRQHQQLPPQHSAYNHHHGTVTSSPETVHYPMGYADAASGTQQPNISLQPVHGQGLPYQSAHPNLPHSDPTGSHNSQLRQPAYIHYSIQPSQYHELPNHNATPDESVHHHPDLQREVQPHHFQHHFNAERLFASQPLYRYSDTNPTLSSSTSSNLLTLGRPLLPSLNNRLHHGHMPGSMVGAGINDDTSSTRPMQIGVCELRAFFQSFLSTGTS